MKTIYKRYFVLFLILLVAFNASAKESKITNEKSLWEKSTFGIGVGTPYGMAGININLKINEHLDVFAGLGLGYGAGLRYYPFPKKNQFNLIASYGTNALILKRNPLGIEQFNGVNIGVGFGKWFDHWEIDLMYILPPTEEVKNRVNELYFKEYSSVPFEGGFESSLLLSAGYRW